MLKTRARIDDRYDHKAIVVYKTGVLDPVAELAVDLIVKHAMVAAVGNGEDSSGRQCFRLQTPEELVQRSFEIATRTFEVAAERGLIVDLPDLNELNADYDAAKAEHRLRRGQ